MTMSGLIHWGLLVALLHLQVQATATTPQVTAIEGCQQSGSLAAGCEDGQLITIVGHGLGDYVSQSLVAITWSGGNGRAPGCTVVGVTNTRVQCRLSVQQTTSNRWSATVWSGPVASTGTVGIEFVDVSSGPVVSSVTGCTTNGSDAAGCGNQAVITVHGGGFDGTTTGMNVVALTGGQGPVPTCGVIGSTSTSLVCILQYDETATSGKWLVVTWVGRVAGTGTVSMSFGARPPVLEAISGCVRNGPSAWGCGDETTITIEGHGFNEDYRLNVVTFTGGEGTQPVCRVVKSSTPTAVKCQLSIATDISGTWVVGAFNEAQAATGTVTIGFPAPANGAPRVWGVTGCGQDGADASGCVSDRVITIHGAGFNKEKTNLNTVIFTGGQGSAPTCAVTRSTSTSVECILWYDERTTGRWLMIVYVGPVAASGTVSVSMEATASRGLHLTSVTGCVTDGAVATGCEDGQVVTIHGEGFNEILMSNVVMMGNGNGAEPTCIVTGGHSGEWIECRLSVQQSTSGRWLVTVWSGPVASTGNVAIEFVGPSSGPVVTGISGCAVSGAEVSGCGNQAVITVHGGGFETTNLAMNVVLFQGGPQGDAPVCRVTHVSFSSIECILHHDATTRGKWLAIVFVGATASTGTISVNVDPSGPMVSAIGGCSSVGPHVAGCEGSITVFGSDFGSIADTSVTFVGGEGTSPECAVQRVTPTAVVCALQHQGSRGVWLVNVKSPVPVVGELSVAFPWVTGLEGCDPRVASSCHEGSSVTITGQGFAAVHQDLIAVLFESTATSKGPSPSCSVVSITNDHIVCKLSVSPQVGGSWLMRPYTGPAPLLGVKVEFGQGVGEDVVRAKDGTRTVVQPRRVWVGVLAVFGIVATLAGLALVWWRRGQAIRKRTQSHYEILGDELV